MTLATLVLFGIFLSLGRWQWQRGEAKQAAWAEYERNAPAESIGPRRMAELARFAHVRIEGTFQPERQFLLDNRSYQGKPGYEVLTPFRRAGGDLVLVNRGWIPFSGFRDRLPDVSIPAAPVSSQTISGRIDELPAAGLASGRAAPDPQSAWPKLTSFPTHGELEAALSERIDARILLLDPDVPGGYVRDWKPPGLDPSRHFSYAIQWWGFAVLLLVLYFGLNIRKVS